MKVNNLKIRNELISLKFIPSVLLIIFSVGTASIAQDWTEVMKVVASDREEGHNYGYSVDIDGNYAIVGSRNGDEGSGNYGSAYIVKEDIP